MVPPQQCVEVALLAPLPAPLSYLVPPGEVPPPPGTRVKVPLGRRSAVGVVIGCGVPPEGVRLKQIQQRLDSTPLFDMAWLEFIRRAAAYYLFPLGLALKTALPAGLASLEKAPGVKHTAIYSASARDGQPGGVVQRRLLEFIRSRQGVAMAAIRQRFASPYAALRRLEELGFITRQQCEISRDPFSGQQIQADTAVTLNHHQAAALRELCRAVDAAAFAPFLLHGVTGSGKTEVYLQTIAATLEQGRQALVLVPEIALTPQLVGRFRARFEQRGARVGVLHSGMSAAERYDMWRAITRDEVDIVIGARSAVFAPLTRLGIIVVDEEHDDSYKQGDGFRYNGRDLALMRAQMAAVPVVLGSATPSLASFQRAADGAVQALLLPQRVSERPLPQVTLVDMKAAAVEHGLAQELRDAIAATLQRDEQCLLLLNRRGFSPYLLCGDCGASYRCPNCAITLTWHKSSGVLRCHYCDYQQCPDDTCPRCGGSAMEPEGMGTEGLAAALAQLYPQARIARMDRDTTSGKGSQQQLFERMSAGAIDILVGTQMIAKGHDFANVTLVGVVDADTTLNFPDFRSAERSFSLLTQVAGRCGRGDKAGQVFIQTYAADHPALQCAASHDYAAFAAQELPLRQLLGYPPCGHLVNVIISGLEQSQVEQAARQLAQQLGGAAEVEILGPAPCPLARLRNRHRMQILLKAATRPPLRRLLNGHHGWKQGLPPTVRIDIDVDPVDMM